MRDVKPKESIRAPLSSPRTAGTARSLGLRGSLSIGGSALLLVGLGVLQHRWVGDLGAAETKARRENLALRLERIALDLDRELFALHCAMTGEMSFGTRREPKDWLAAWRRWKETSPFPDLVEGFYLARGERRRHPASSLEPAEIELSRVEIESSELEPFAGDDELRTLARLLCEAASEAQDRAQPDLARCLGWRPAVVVPVLEHAEGEPGRFSSHLIVVLDRAVLFEQTLPALVRRHLGDEPERDYSVFLIADSDEESPCLFSSDEGIGAGGRASFDDERRMGRLIWSRLDLDGDEGARAELEMLDPRASRKAIRMLQRLGSEDGGLIDAAGLLGKHSSTVSFEGSAPPAWGIWRLRARHRSGSLEAVARKVQLRNLSLGILVLVLLGIAMATLSYTSASARRLARQRMEFVAGVSHELRTPLAVITSAAENLADGIVEGESVENRDAVVREYGSLIVERSRHLSRLVEDVLQLAGAESRASGGTGRAVGVSEIAAGELIHRAVAACRGLASEAEAIVDVAVAEGLPALCVDPTALGAAIENLIENAIKYGRPSGRGGERAGPRITIEADFGGSPGEVIVAVQDSGPGIPEDEQPRVFEPFFRGRGAAGTRGSGLGLSLVRRIVEVHGGSVELASEEGAGTRVAVHLPISRSQSHRCDLES